MSDVFIALFFTIVSVFFIAWLSIKEWQSVRRHNPH